MKRNRQKKKNGKRYRDEKVVHFISSNSTHNNHVLAAMSVFRPFVGTFCYHAYIYFCCHHLVFAVLFDILFDILLCSLEKNFPFCSSDRIWRIFWIFCNFSLSRKQSHSTKLGKAHSRDWAKEIGKEWWMKKFSTNILIDRISWNAKNS